MSAVWTPKEMRQLPQGELVREIQKRRLDLAKIRVTIHLQKEKDTAKLRKERRIIARLQTVLRERRTNPGT